MTTVRYPIYRLAHDPKFRVIVGAYNQRLANKFSRKMRKLVRAIAATKTATGEPHKLQFSRDAKAVEDWETSEGGGVRAVGVGGGVTGMGANLIVIDDPVKQTARFIERRFGSGTAKTFTPVWNQVVPSW